MTFERNPGSQRALHPRGRDVLVQDVRPTAAQRYDVAVSEFEEYLRVRDTHGLEEVVRDGPNGFCRACIQYLQVCFASGSLKKGYAGTLISARSSGADPEDRHSVFRTLWRVHRSWFFTIWAELRLPVSQEIVLSVATPTWLRNVPELSLLTLLSFHCLLCPAEGSQLRWYDVESFDESLSTRCERVHKILHIREPKTRSMSGHAAQHHVLLKCPECDEILGPRSQSRDDDLGVHCC